MILYLQTIIAIFTFGKEFLKYLESKKGSGCSPKDARKDSLTKINEFKSVMRKGRSDGNTTEIEQKFAELGIKRADVKRVSDK